MSRTEIWENTKLAREMAVMGNYESSSVYYEGTIQQINRLVMTSDHANKQKWLAVSLLSFVFTFRYVLGGCYIVETHVSPRRSIYAGIS